MSSSETATEAASSSETTGGADCVDNVANEPWCFRRFTIPLDPRRGHLGRYGPKAEPRFFLLSYREDAALLGWDGFAVSSEPVQLVVDVPGPGLARWLPIAVGDDGRDDVLRHANISARDMTQRLALYESSPTGFAPPHVTEFGYPEARWPHAAVDVNGDGVDEFLVQDWNGIKSDGVPRLRVLEWRRNTFAPMGDPIEYINQGCGYPTDYEAIDIDGDPFEDTAISTDCSSNPGVSQMYVVRGAPTTAQMQRQIVYVPVDDYVDDISVLDANGDGVDDIAAVRAQGLSLVIGRGDGVFDAELVVWDGAPNLAVDGDLDWTWTFGDLDGDGTSEPMARRTVILNAAEDPTFVEYLPQGSIAPTTASLAVGDISGDGIADLVFGVGDAKVEVLISEQQ